MLLFLLFIAGMMVTQLQLDSFREKAVFASHIEKNFFDLFVIAHDMKEKNRFERARQQWPPITRELGQQLPKARGMFSSADESELVETLLEYFEDSQRDFRELEQWLDRHQSQALNTAQQDYLPSLSERLHIGLQSAIPIANRIAAINRENAVAFDKKRENALASMLIFLAGALLLTLWPLIRGITRSVEQLKTGMNQAALGDLELRIAMMGKDEFAQLARHFNEMISKLAEVTVARETLSAEVIERKRAEKARKDSEQRFRDIVNSTDGIVWEADASTFNFTFISQQAERLLGYPLEDWLKPGFWVEHLHPDDKDWASEYCASCTRQLEPHDFEYRFIARDGRTVWLRDLIVVVAEDGMPRWLRGIMLDITGRKQAEDELKLSAQLLNSTSDTVFLLDPDGNFVYLNEAAWKSRGYTRGEMMGMNLRELNAPEFNKLLAPRIKAVMENGHGFFESAHRCKDGTVMPVEINVRVIESGGRKLMLSVIRDITERKLAEEKLLKSEASLRAILDNMPYLAWLKDTAGRFIAVNDAFINTTVQKRMQDVLGKTDFDLWPKELAEKYRADDAEVMALRQQKYIEEPALDGDRSFWVETFKTPVIDKNGNVLGTTGLARDITERKEYEEELKRSNAELEQFSYAVSHDMRQPLRVISSYLQLLEISIADQLDGEKRGYFDFAIEGAKRIDQMLVALLEYSRVGKMGEPPTWIESRALLDEALQFLQPAIAEAQAKVSIAGEWPRIFASHDEILRLLQNLIGNAAKYRIAGRAPEITVTGEVAGNEWRLCVADNGVGIIPDQIKRLFQVFQRLQSREAYEGTGIGLALCRKIAEHHKGRIWAESAGEGKGSKFCVVLPVLRDRQHQ